MDKSKLLNFINKYSLNGLCNTVKWSAKNRGLVTDFITDDKNILGKVAVKAVNFPEGQYGIYNTKGLVKLLGILQNEVDLDVEDNTSLTFTDKTISAKFLLASLDIIASPPAATLPEFDFEFDINSIFIDRFIKARAALDEATVFAFAMIEGKISIVLNYALHNTDRIIIPLESNYTLSDPLVFNIDNFKEILAANKDCTGKVSVSTQGLLMVKCQAEDIASVYYQVMLES